MVKPGGTGRPRFVISARLAPLPPRRYFCSLPPSSNAYTYFGIVLRCLSVGVAHHDRLCSTIMETLEVRIAHPRRHADQHDDGRQLLQQDEECECDKDKQAIAPDRVARAHRRAVLADHLQMLRAFPERS